MKASRRFGEGSRQMRREEFAKARDTFLATLQVLGASKPKNMAQGPWFATRFETLRGLAYCAAKLNDVPLTRSSIEYAFSLWEGMNIGPPTSLKEVPEWMAWARTYLASSGPGDIH